MFLADCVPQLCSWDHLCNTQEYGQFLEVLHVLVKHPEQYRRDTGNDPDEMKFKYKEYIEAWGHLL